MFYSLKSGAEILSLKRQSLWIEGARGFENLRTLDPPKLVLKWSLTWLEVRTRRFITSLDILYQKKMLICLFWAHKYCMWIQWMVNTGSLLCCWSYLKLLLFNSIMNTKHVTSAQVFTTISHSNTSLGCCAGINRGSCFRINHFPEDNDYDTDSSEYILRKSLQPPHLQTLQLLNPIFSLHVVMDLSQGHLMCHDISIPPP